MTVTAVGVVVIAGSGFAGYRYLSEPAKDPRPEVVEAASKIVERDGLGGRVIDLIPADPNGKLVLYAHGHEQDARDVYADPEIAGVTSALLEHGYTVVAADAGGNNWGNEEGVESYASAVERASETYDLDGVAVVVESMGALAGLPVADKVDAAAVVAWYPVCDASSLADDEALTESIEESGVDEASVSPVPAPAAEMMIWASPDDTRVPYAENAEACTAAASDRATLIETSGDPGDASNFDADAVVAFLDQALR